MLRSRSPLNQKKEVRQRARESSGVTDDKSVKTKSSRPPTSTVARHKRRNSGDLQVVVGHGSASKDEQVSKSAMKKRGFDKKSGVKARSPTAWNLKPSASQAEFDECMVPDKKKKGTLKKNE